MDNFFEILRTEKIEANIFKGQTIDIGAPQLFGGIVLGQALYAASLTVPNARPAHSLHAYFILPGDSTAPVIYEVDRIREGGSFTTRRIIAIQHGRPIFNMSASFHKLESGIEHQIDPPEIKGPDDLKSLTEIYIEAAQKSTGKEKAYFEKWSEKKFPIEIRPSSNYDLINPVKRDPESSLWFKILAEIPDELFFRKAVLAFISDYTLLSTALLPHGLTWVSGIKQAASLDHAMWFHNDFDASEWMMYTMDSPHAGNARGMTRGLIYNREGKLIASVAQEGLIRT